jgi:hypothetical protein
MQVPYEFQLAGLIVGAVGGVTGLLALFITYLNYRLSRHNQSLPLRQELYKRQADGFAALCVGCQDLQASAWFHVSLAVLVGLDSKEAKRSGAYYLRNLLKLDRLHAKFIAFLPPAFNSEFNKFKKALAGIVTRAEKAPRATELEIKESMGKLFDELKATECPYNAARKAMGTEALTAGNAGLIALHEINPATVGPAELLRLAGRFVAEVHARMNAPRRVSRKRTQEVR